MKVLFYSALDASPSTTFPASNNNEFLNVQGTIEGIVQVVNESVPDILFIDGFSPTQQLLTSLERVATSKPRLEMVLCLNGSNNAINKPSQDFLLKAMRVGVREIIESLTVVSINDYLNRAFVRINNFSVDIKRPKVIAFIGGKGGDGGSAIASNLSFALSHEAKLRTLLIDLSLPFGDIEIFITKEPRTYDLTNFSEEVDRLDEALMDSMVQHISPNFDFIASPQSVDRMINVKPKSINRIIDVAAAYYDFVVLDMGYGVDPVSMQALEKSDQLYLVCELSIPSLRKASQLISFWNDYGYDSERISIIINKFVKGGDVKLSDFEKVTGKDAFKVFPEERKSFEASVLKGSPVYSLFPNSNFSKVIHSWVLEWFKPNVGKTLWQRLKIK